jgi:hypothetical protein
MPCAPAGSQVLFRPCLSACAGPHSSPDSLARRARARIPTAIAARPGLSTAGIALHRLPAQLAQISVALRARVVYVDYDLTGPFRDAGELAGCSHHTVARYVRAREEGRLVPGSAEPRAMLAGGYLDKLEELVERSKGKIRADKAHRTIAAMGFTGSERTTRRAVAKLKHAYHAGRRRVHRPWVAGPGMWAQYDFGDGPAVNGAATVLFCFWLAWCRFRVVLPILDKTQASVQAACDAAFRRVGGVPAYLLTDNEKTVTVEHVAGIPVRNPAAVEFGRHYGLTVATCVPYDPASKGGSESTVKLAKADIVPTDANLLPAHCSPPNAPPGQPPPQTYAGWRSAGPHPRQLSRPLANAAAANVCPLLRADAAVGATAVPLIRGASLGYG